MLLLLHCLQLPSSVHLTAVCHKVAMRMVRVAIVCKWGADSVPDLTRWRFRDLTESQLVLAAMVARLAT